MHLKGKPIGTDLLHADHDDDKNRSEVAPSISVTTTFRGADPRHGLEHSDLLDPLNPSRHVYSRYTQDVSHRAEKILSKINGGFALTYSSGLAASYAALVHYAPKRVAITDGYHGFHSTLEVYKKSKGSGFQVIGLDDDFQTGDICWLETPLNPTGESRNIKYYADKVHAVGGHLIVDSTFAPPPLQYPLKFGADAVMHSGTKYLGGHSDLLCGVLVVKTAAEWNKLWSDRTYTGNMMGSLESWLLLRSLRTLHLRVPRQSSNATELVQWLHKLSGVPADQRLDGIQGGIIEKVWHSSLQAQTASWDIRAQMEGGWNATFGIFLRNKEHAALLPFLLRNFTPATSLGGVESLIEQRLQSDPGADPRLVRISVGVEDIEDLKDDLREAFKRLVKEKPKL
ncbi:cystathionine gamma-synthase [Rickenella mellea]|uniref:Cystathionine gamma-synthase n=1 Tax=Rickenella mellea TaxID=50990 RepID=A0A4R5XE87_9AGAM|nr:cystathionine gamma-synthase [Rickenella mellea]